MKPEPRMGIGRTAAGWGAVPMAALVAAACAAPAPLEHEERAMLAAAEELACYPSEVMWDAPRSDASRCEGPWEYEQHAVRESAHEDCGVHSCAEDELCTSWSARTVTYRDRFPLVFACADRPLPRGSCQREPDLGLAYEECDDFARARQRSLNARPDRRSARILSATIEPDLGTRRVECAVALAYEQRTQRVCGCAQWRYKECPHADPSLPPVTVRSAPGRTLAEVRAAHDAEAVPGQAAVDELRLECTTAEEPALSPQARFARLSQSLQDPALAAEGTRLHARLGARLRLVYELFGARLTPAQRAQARTFYESDRDSDAAAEPACGRHVPADMPRCHPQVDAALRLCTRLGSAHVSPALVEADYYACLGLLTDLGAALEAGTCQGDAPYVDASLAAHRRLHEGLFVHMVSRPADALHLLDRWYAAVSAVIADADGRRRELALGVNQLWQATQGHRPSAGAGHGWGAGSLYGTIASALADADEKVRQGDQAGARQVVADALALADGHARILDQAILRAAYADVEGTAAPVLTGAPLMRITADALAPLADRLEALTPYHDLGCALAGCASFATPTRLSRLWQALAHLDDGRAAPVSLGAVLDAMPDDLSGWMPVFGAIRTHQERLLAALADAPPDAARDLVDLIARAEARAASYEQTGMLQPALGHTLHTGVHSAQRQRVLDHIDEQRLMLEGAHADLEQRLVSLVHGLVRVRDGAATRARLEAERARVRLELDALDRREASYRRLIADGAAPGQAQRPMAQEGALFEELMADWARAEGGADGATYLRVGDRQVLRLTGADARFRRWDTQSVADIAAGMRAVEAGQVVSVATEPGTVWAPTCAVRQVRLVTPDNAFEGAAEPLALETKGAVTGPEGYTLTWTGSAYRAASRHAGNATRVTAGKSLRWCAGIPGLRELGFGPDQCAYRELSRSGERGQTWQRGREGRTSAQLAGGLYVPGTPFEAPAGSLVVVEMPPGQTDPARLRNVHLVRAPHTTIAVEDAADLYFVANDPACRRQDRAHVLEVTVGTFVPLDAAADALVRRMAHTLALVRARAPEVIARGQLLPTERRLLEQDALLAQLGGPDELQIPVEDYPSPLSTLFDRFLARELVRLEAMAALATIEVEQEIKRAEHRAIAAARHQATLSGYLLGLVPRWTVRGLRLAEMRAVASDYTRDMRHFLLPLLDLWYPEVAAALPDVDVVQRLAHVDVDTPLLDLVAWQAALGRRLHRRLAEARLPYPSDEDTARTFVTLRFPKPALMAPSCAGVPSARCPLANTIATFRWATVTEAQALWETLTAPLAPGTTQRRLTFQVKPDDLYEPYAGTAYLSCRQALPVVRRLGLVLPGFDGLDLPRDPRFVEGRIPAPARLGFATTEGVWTFELVSPVWRALNRIPLVFAAADYLAAEQRFLAIPQDVRGVSPFTTFELLLPEAVIEEWEIRQATSIDLVMELESIRTGAPVAVPACALEEEEALLAEATETPTSPESNP